MKMKSIKKRKSPMPKALISMFRERNYDNWMEQNYERCYAKRVRANVWQRIYWSAKGFEFAPLLLWHEISAYYPLRES